MGYTVNIMDAGILILVGLGILLLYNLIVLVRNTIPVMKSLAQMADDATHITAAAKEGTENAEKILSEAGTVVSDMAGLIKGNQSFFSAATHLVNAIAGLVNLIKKEK